MGSAEDPSPQIEATSSHTTVPNPPSINKLIDVYDGLKKSSTPSLESCATSVVASPNDTKEKTTKNVSMKRKISSSEEAETNKKSRFIWDDYMHRLFIASVFDIGLKSAKPKLILGNMEFRPDNLTTENIKSHLQKYRSNSSKYRTMFLKQFDIAKLQVEQMSDGRALNPGFHAYPLPVGMFDLHSSSPTTTEVMAPVYALDETRSSGYQSDCGSSFPGQKETDKKVPEIFEQMEVQMRIHQQIQEQHDSQRHRQVNDHDANSRLDQSQAKPRNHSGSIGNEDFFDDLFDFLQ